MEELIAKLSQMNSDELQQFCLLDAEKDECDALALEAYLLELISNALESETLGDEDEETRAEKIIRLCVEAMDIPATLSAIGALKDADWDA